MNKDNILVWVLFAVIALFGAFEVGRGYEIDRIDSAYNAGYEDAFEKLAVEVRGGFDCVVASDACLQHFTEITDF